jgi:hypothetical protein
MGYAVSFYNNNNNNNNNSSSTQQVIVDCSEVAQVQVQEVSCTSTHNNCCAAAPTAVTSRKMNNIYIESLLRSTVVSSVAAKVSCF